MSTRGTDPNADRAAELARHATDPNRLLPGEDPLSTHPDDCRHWIDVYSELIAFKQEVLDRMERATRELPDPGPAEVGYDLEISQIEFARLRRRREFWEHRQAELRGR